LDFEEIKRQYAKMLLRAAKFYARIYDFDKAVALIKRSSEVITGESDDLNVCLPCKEAKARNLLAIIEELERML